MARDAASARIRAAKLTQVLNRIIQRTGLAEGIIHVAVHDGNLGSPTVDQTKGVEQPASRQSQRFLSFGEFQTCIKQQVAALLEESHLRFGGFHVFINGGKVGRYKVVFGLLPEEIDDLARTLYASFPSGDD